MIRFIVLLSAVAFAAAARAELLPSEVAVVAARGNQESEDLAAYYAKARGIPAANVCLIDMPDGEECPRAAWDHQVRPAIVEWLAANDPEHKLRCLATVWGVPLSIAAAAPTAELRAYQDFLAGERGVRVAGLRDTIQQIDALVPPGEVSTHAVGAAAAGVGGAAAAGGKPQPPAETPPPAGSPAELAWLQSQLETAIKAAQSRINALPLGETRQTAQSLLQRYVTAAGGAVILLQNLQQQASSQRDPPPAVVAEFHRLRGAASAWVETRQLLERRPPGIERDLAILPIVDRIGGVLATVPWLDDQLAAAAANLTAASFDSELALVLWPAGYELLGRQPNYLRAEFEPSHLRTAFPTLMVARLDGPTPAAARGIVDAALAAERDGLAGKAYFDSRGITARTDVRKTSQAAAAEFDQAILAAARGFQGETTVPTVVNELPALFAAGECPDAALYCGWYSLGKYVDAFAFNPGAVAYHAAGDEAAGLHDAASQRWCKRLLEDGAAATIGAVFGDDAAAFPWPNEFFRRLAGGDLTLAECYWQTLPATSWSVLLIGDPLYRPFKNRQVAKDQAAIRDAGR